MSSNNADMYTRAIALATIAGKRSASAPAFLSYDAVTNKRKLKGTPFEKLGTREASGLLALAAAGEMVADKLPFLPNRTDLQPLLGRAAFGAVCAAAVFAEEGEPPLAGAAIGAAVAVVSTHVSFRIRRFLNRKVKLPNVLSGLLEDAAVVAIGRAVTRS